MPAPRSRPANDFQGIEPLEVRTLWSAVALPSPDVLIYVAQGPSAPVIQPPTTSTTGNSSQSHALSIQITQAMLDASPNGSVSITIHDADLHGANDGTDQDILRGDVASPTRFRLLDSTSSAEIAPPRFVDGSAPTAPASPSKSTPQATMSWRPPSGPPSFTPPPTLGLTPPKTSTTTTTPSPSPSAQTMARSAHLQAD